jgi:magnesium transporter
MVEHFKQGKVRWVNLKNPTTEEVKRISKELDLPIFLLSDLTTPVPKNSAVCLDSIIKVTLDFPVIKRLDIDHQFEVKFIVTPRCLLTAHYEEMEGIDRFKRQFDVAATLRRKQNHITGMHLFFTLLNNLYESASSKLDYVESNLTHIESELFTENEKQLVYKISDIRKKIIAFRHVIRAHEDVFHEARPLIEKVYDGHFNSDLQNIESHYFILQRRVNTQFETLAALHETNKTLLTTKQNEIMKIFTIMAFITFPLMLFTSLFGMNTLHTPILGMNADFWVIVGIMTLATAGLYLFFKHKEWI